MSISPELLKQIMGSPDSVTAKLVSLRETPGDEPLKTGVWYSNFTRVKTEAERRGVPFFAMWTNGDLCGFCRRFTKNILDDKFIQYMRGSGGLWWLGGSMDDNDEDARSGKGFAWCQGPARRVSYFPFFAVSHIKDGKAVRAFFGSGHDYDRKAQWPDGTPHILSKLAEIFAGKETMPGDAATVATPVRLNTVLHIRFNQTWDAAHIARFQAALKENGGHCICQPKSPDTMCMCKAFLEKDTPGPCHCGAFEKYEV